MGQRTNDIALKLDFIGSSLPQVRKFEGVVNVLQVHLFLHCPRKQLHLKHVHNALEFADLREGAPYEVEFEGNVISPLAHVAMHAAVKGQIEQVPEVRTAFEKMVASGTPAHHAEHVLAALVGELM